MSRIEEAKRRLREAADAAELRRHVPELVRHVPLRAFVVGAAVAALLLAVPPVRRRLLRAMLPIEDPYRPSLGAPRHVHRGRD